MNISLENVSSTDPSSSLYSPSPLENIALSIFYILVFIVAVPGNGLALWAFCSQEISSPFTLFLRHLAVADLSYTLLLPMRVFYHLWDHHWPFGLFLCNLSCFLFFLNMYCSLYLMGLISVDRLVAVVLPLKAAAVRKVRYAKVAVGVLWATLVVLSSPTFFSGSSKSIQNGTCVKLYLERPTPTALAPTIVAFSIPLVTIVVSYILILLKLRSARQQREQAGVRDKAVTMIILVITNFLLAFVPYHVSRVIYIVFHCDGQVSGRGLGSLARANRITSALTCVSGILDPVMYFFLNQVYRNKLTQLFCKKKT